MPTRSSFSLALLALPTFLAAQDLESWCLPQSAGRFWSISNGEIQEWTISGGTISGGATVLTGPADMNSLAFCSASSPTTFYGDATDTGLQYYDGGNWVQVPLAQSVYNHGGSGTHLYYVDLDNDLYHFSNGITTLIADPAPGSFRSDMVVDADGNALVAYAPSGIGQFATAFRKYSPTGTVLATYTTSFDPTQSWGSFLLGNTIYIAFGVSNDMFPEQLVPFVLSGTTATAGTPIPFVSTGLFDLASCTENVVGIAERSTEQTALTAWPVPADEAVTIALPADLRAALRTLVVFDVNGRTVQVDAHVQDGVLRIATDAIAEGSYQLVATDNAGRSYRPRWMVVHAS